jgi:hypothetical protein
MSVQLIVYPQSVTTTTTTSTTASGVEFLSDGQNFNTINTAPQINCQDVNFGLYQSAIVNGASATYGTTPVVQCNGQYPSIPNSWYVGRVRSNWVAAGPDADAPPLSYPGPPKGYLAFPTQDSGDVVFEAERDGAYGQWGGAIYQRLTNLVVGNTYTITVKDSIDPAKDAYLMVNVYPPNFSGYQIILSSGNTGYLNGTDNVFTFVATDTSMIFWCGLGTALNQPITDLHINSISIMGDGLTTTTSTVVDIDLSGQEILDLYEDESIPLTLSVDDFKDVATKTQSYSKAFNLPATKKNNKVFGSLYEVTKQAGTGTFGFNPYARTSMTLKENGFIVFEGFLRLIDIIDKDGEISYNVNLYSETVAFMDVLKDKTFYDLNLCELDHDYDLPSIQASQTGVLPLTNPLQADSFAGATGATTTDVLKYPLVDWAGSMRREATTKEINLGATAGNPSMTRLEDGFRPFIKLKYLVDNIFADAGFTYDSVFFGSTYFNKLFMDFNWGEERDGSAPNRNDFTRRMSNTSASPTYVAQHPTWTNVPVSLADTSGPGGGSTDLWHNSNYKFISDVNNLVVTGNYKIWLENKPLPGNSDTWNSTARICKFNSNNNVLEKFEETDINLAPGESYYIQGSYETVLNNGDYIQMEATTYNSDGDIFIGDNGSDYSYLTCYYNNNAVGVCSLLQAARGELAQWDFFKGLTTMFNLITLQDPVNPSNLLIEPYDDIFTVNPNIKTLDWTKKVDISDIKLKPLDLERRVVLQFEEDEEDYPFSVYKAAAAGYLYGSGVVDIDGFDVFQGDKEVVASPFAATIFKNLFDDIFDFYAPVIYGSNEERTEFGPIKNLPRILYDTGVYTISSTTFFIPAQNGEALSNETSYSLFSHTDVVEPASTDVDLSFSVSPYQLLVGVAPLQNLFTNYYFNYFAELYNIDVKTMSIKVLLTPEDIANFNFYDKILIKNREYRVDKLNYKPNDLSTVEFILII